MRTHVDLDVHARNVLGCAIDQRTGEIKRQRLAANNAAVVDWVKGPEPPARVVYEAGPTGFGLARTLETAGISCVVAASSKLQRPPGDPVKADARDAEHLARLNLLDQIAPVAVPGSSREAARDLVRAREDVRSDLMRSGLPPRYLMGWEGAGKAFLLPGPGVLEKDGLPASSTRGFIVATGSRAAD